jgi:glycosyltransferase involved in cell wall biosynthesis
MGSSVLEMLVGLHGAGLLKQAIVSSCKTDRLPRELVTEMGFLGRVQKRLSLYDPTGWCANYIEGRIFDLWTSRVMQPSPVFSSWTGICATSLRTAKQRGSFTILGLGSAHPRTTLELINRERQQWGMPALRVTPHILQIEQELALANKIIVQSQFSQRTLVERGLSAEKIVCLPLGVNIERFRPASTPPSGPFRVLFLGQVMLRKGIQYLLEAWKQLGWRDAELWIVGKVMSDSRPVLRHYADLPGVRLMGHVPDQLAAFQSAHVFVMPSVEDGFGLAVIEAMACGLPVIVSDHTGAADLVRQGESGFVVPYSGVAQYMDALETLRADPDLRRETGGAGHATAQEQTWDQYREQMVPTYRR